MSGERRATDLGGEREIDLARWRDAALANWWLAAAGLVAGIVVSSLYTLSGHTTYTASALIARGQAFNPAGTATVLSYLSSPVAIQAYATTPATLEAVAAKVGMSAGELRGHITTSTLTREGTASTTNTNSILVQITVKLNRPKRAEDAANALAAIITRATTSDYVRQSISIYKVRLGNYAARIKTLQGRIQSLNETLAHSGSLQPLDRLVLVSELDQAEAALGQTLDSQTTTQTQLTLAEDVEQTQLIQKAQAVKSVGRSRRNSVLVGGLIGLILGAIVATVYGLRVRRTLPG
jgi:uncharacterized protein involved in exopolysaccharide biosynthesis